MRPIKFRAWDTKHKFMVDQSYGDWVSFDGVLYTEAEKKYNTPHIEIERAKDYILMQFTGRLDKNGKEIYEGDICKRNIGDLFVDYWLIEWLDETAGFTTTYIGEGKDNIYYPKLPQRNSYSRRFNEMEVIGNIYQTPNSFLEPFIILQ